MIAKRSILFPFTSAVLGTWMVIGCATTEPFGTSRQSATLTPATSTNQATSKVASEATAESSQAAARRVSFDQELTLNPPARPALDPEDKRTPIESINPALDPSTESTEVRNGVFNEPPTTPVGRAVELAPSATREQRVSSPITLSSPSSNLSELPDQLEAVTLEETIQMALMDTKVLRSLSANVVQNAASVPSAYDPGLRASDPNFGVDAALSLFDPTLSGSTVYSNNDDFFNNPTLTGNAAEVQQNLTSMNLSWNKVARTGTQLTLNHVLTHDDNTNRSVLFPSSWEHQLEATVRQPLWQGRGRLFNEIAGPNSRPGFLGTSGLLISRTDHRISIDEFQRGVRDFLVEVVNAYWQLDLAYRNYETIKSARDASRETWKVAKARFDNGLPGGEADREAQARAQYYQFELQLDRALNGAGGNASPGILQAEANLRRLLNLPLSDGVLIRPIDSPANVASIVDWQQLAPQALASRVEICQQQERLRRSELLLIAAKNFTMPRLDALATYRNSGLGDDLINGSGKFAGAFNEAWAGNYDEWEFGVTFDVPVHFRQAKSGVRNAELQVGRERAVLRELEQQILHDLGTSVRSLEQTNNAIRLAELRQKAALDSVKARQAAYEADAVGFEDLLDSQQRYLEAALELHTAKTDRELAMTQLYTESGKLLDEYQVLAQ